VSSGVAGLGVPKSSSELCRTRRGAAPTQSLLVKRLIVERSAARSLHVHGQAAGGSMDRLLVGPWAGCLWVHGQADGGSMHRLLVGPWTGCWWVHAQAAGGSMGRLLVGPCTGCWWVHAQAAGGSMGRLLVGPCTGCWWVHAQAAGGSMDRLLVARAPPPRDLGKLQPPSCPWGWWSLVPVGAS